MSDTIHYPADDQKYEHWTDFNFRLHRPDGPAIVKDKRHPYNDKIWFYIHGENITNEVTQWIEDNNYPIWKNEQSWDENIKLHFKLTFVN